MNEQVLMLPAPSPPLPGQALLFSREIEVEIEKEEAVGRYTLERFRKLRPEAYQDCVALLAAAKPGYEGLRRIAKIVGCHHLTVAAVRDDAGETIDTLRDGLSRKMLTAVDVLVDRLLEHPDLIPAGMIGMNIDQLTKNAELLGNRATQRIEKTERVDIYASWDEIVEKVLEPGAVHELDSETGLAGGNNLAIEAAAGDPIPSLAMADSDAQSPVPATDRPGRRPADTTSDTDPDRSEAELDRDADGPDVRNRGGRGSQNSGGGGPTRSGSKQQNFPANGAGIKAEPL